MIKILLANIRILFKSVKPPRKSVFVVMSVIIAMAALFLLSAMNTRRQKEGIVINEVVSGSSDDIENGVSGSPDWIELYNASEEDVDISGYRITDRIGKAGYEFNGVTIKKNGYLLVYASKSAPREDSGICCADFGISGKGETLYLVSPKNAVVSEINVPDMDKDISYARREDGTYGFCISTTPGTQNTNDILDEEQLRGALKETGIIISEVMPSAKDGCAWAELYNKADSDIDLGNYYITDDQGDPVKWRMPEQTLKAGKYAVVYLSGENTPALEMHASFTLGSADTGLYLYTAGRTLISSLKWDSGMPYGMSVVADNTYSVTPTKGCLNSKETLLDAEQSAMGEGDAVRISELLQDNKYSIADSDGERSGWVEIHNSGNESIPLKGYYLSDNDKELFKWAFPDIEIGPDGYLVVFLSGKDRTAGELHASFSLSEGEGVYLTNISEMNVDEYMLPQTIRCNVSEGKDETGAYEYYDCPTPGGANEEGVSDITSLGCFNSNGMYISEVCAAETAKSSALDWIELHNSSSTAVDVTGYFLSDDVNDLDKWSIPSMNIVADGYAVIEASSRSVKLEIADFGIAPEGETIFLSDASGNMIDAFDTGVLREGITSGRIEGVDSIARVFFDAPTRGGKNSASYYKGYAGRPEFSESGLYHKQSFMLDISCPTPGSSIYYTTDGSVPDQSSNLFTAPISISQNVPVRAIAYAKGMLPSEVTTGTYVFDAPHTLPVFCITGNPSEIKALLDTDKDKKPEYPIYAEYYETDGTLGVAFPSGLRPKGKSSLRLPQNSLCMSLRSDYGQKSVIYPFFDDSDITEYTTLSLRSGGQDSVNAKIRDSFFQAVEKGLNADGINTKPVIVYANGQYCGLYDLNEEQNEDYIKTYYGIDSSNIDMIKTKGAVLYGDNKEYRRICKLAQLWALSDDDVFSEFAKYVDIDACTDYLVAQIYFGNGDAVNQRFWRARDYSVKWRPLLFDLDFCLRFSDEDRNTFRKYLTENPMIGGYDMEGNDLTVEMYIFSALKKNKGWRDRFVERFVQLSVTQFDTEKILAEFDAMIGKMRPEMQQHIERWHTPKSMEVWQSQVDKLRSAIEKRQGIALKQLKEYFNVPQETIQKYIEKYSPDTANDIS